MKKGLPVGLLMCFFLLLLGSLPQGCNPNGKEKTTPRGGTKNQTAHTRESRNTTPPKTQKQIMQEKANAFLARYLKTLAQREKAQTTAYWRAANSGEEQDFKVVEKATLALKSLHSDPKKFKEIKTLLQNRAYLDPLVVRSLEIAHLQFKANQMPADMLKKLVEESSKIEQIFNTYRGKLDGKKLSNNALLSRLRKSRSSRTRRKIWWALKQVGDQVGPKLVALAKLRNKAARQMGYKNFWEMKIRLQDHDPKKIMTVFAELEKLTTAPFEKMKRRLDKTLARKFRTRPDRLMPWHYDNPFFQAPPPSNKVDLDIFYKDKNKKEIVDIAADFYRDIGMDIDDIIQRSDLYERAGKDQHAFCISIDRKGDVRTLLNIKPTADWMDTMLHEQGHAVYYKYIDSKLPFVLREAAHIFTTEAVAMLFGALAKNPRWLIDYAKAPPKKVAKLKAAILEQRRREQLIFTRWTLVMLHFEKAMYENPDQDLNKLWWDYVEKYQRLKRPRKTDGAQWAAKPHFTIAPVYYHNYMLGELFAAQLRDKLVRLAGHKGPPHTLSFKGRKDFGTFFKEKIFKPGMRQKWPAFVKQTTGHALSAKFFAAEVK